MRLSPLAYAALALLALTACDDDSSPPVGPSDTIAPDAVTDLSAVVVGDGEVQLTWTAPGDGLAAATVDRYDVRVAYATPFDWNTAVVVPSPPEPSAPGSPQQFTVTGALRGRDLVAAVRALDAAGNLAPVGSVAGVHTPGLSVALTCVDAVTDLPIEGLDVLLTDRTARTLTTSATGEVFATDLAEGAVGIRIETGNAAAPVHRLVDVLSLADDHAGSYQLIEFQDPVSPLYDSILELLLAARTATGGSSILKHWTAYPVPWYAPEFVNTNGVDYHALTEQAAERWNQRTGMQLFVEVASLPATGVDFRYRTRASMGIQNGITEYEPDANGFPGKARISIVNDFPDSPRLYSILMHELGHALGLFHLPDGFIMYGSQPLPADITDDEANVIRLLVSLPNPVDLSLYDPASPR